MTHEWTDWRGNDSQWDELIAGLGQQNVYQTARWAKHKTASGWSVSRIVINRSQPQAAIQFLFRRFPLGFVMAWAPGGFSGDISLINTDLKSTLKRLLQARFLYIRFGMMREELDNETSWITRAGFKQSAHAIGARQSMLLPLSEKEDELISRASSNWKRNYKRSLRLQTIPYVWHSPDSTELALAYEQMDAYKNIKGVKLEISPQTFDSVQLNFGSDLVLIRLDDENGELLSVRGALIQAQTAWDFIAVTSPEGRKNYASHRVLISLAQECARRGCTVLEMGGIDPEKNKGVFDFKNGTGARAITYIGEWEASHPSWLRPIISRVISAKGNN